MSILNKFDPPNIVARFYIDYHNPSTLIDHMSFYTLLLGDSFAMSIAKWARQI